MEDSVTSAVMGVPDCRPGSVRAFQRNLWAFVYIGIINLEKEGPCAPSREGMFLREVCSVPERCS